MKTLLPCPFCLGPAELKQEGARTSHGGFYVECENNAINGKPCGILGYAWSSGEFYGEFPTAEAAAEKWNTRDTIARGFTAAEWAEAYRQAVQILRRNKSKVRTLRTIEERLHENRKPLAERTHPDIGADAAESIWSQFARMMLGDSRVHAIIDEHPNGRMILGPLLAIIRAEDRLASNGYPSTQSARLTLLDLLRLEAHQDLMERNPTPHP